MWHTSTGRIVYDPRRPGLKGNKNKWWCVVLVDKEITRYYRWWIERRYHIKELKQPSWDAHISIIRGYNDRPDKSLDFLWGKYDNEIVEFRYMHAPRQTRSGESKTGHYWFVEVDCPKLVNIRKELNRPYNWKMHITVGRTWY